MKVTLDPTDPDRPGWVRDDDIILTRWYRDEAIVFTSHLLATKISWKYLEAFEIADDHPYAIATNMGYTYWPGGDSEPEDIDKSKLLLFRDKTAVRWPGHRWNHRNTESDIIGYHRKPAFDSTKPCQTRPSLGHRP